MLPSILALEQAINNCKHINVIVLLLLLFYFH